MIERLMNVGIKTICNPTIQKILNKIFGINPNNFTLGFKKVNNRWYSDIKNWPKAYEERQLMVNGADTFLEYLSNGKDYVKLHIKTEDFPGSIHIHKVNEDEWGGTYIVQNKEIQGHQLWLCNVTKFVFGEHPNDIYFEVCGQQLMKTENTSFKVNQK